MIAKLHKCYGNSSLQDKIQSLTVQQIRAQTQILIIPITAGQTRTDRAQVIGTQFVVCLFLMCVKTWVRVSGWGRASWLEQRYLQLLRAAPHTSDLGAKRNYITDLGRHHNNIRHPSLISHAAAGAGGWHGLAFLQPLQVWLHQSRLINKAFIQMLGC